MEPDWPGPAAGCRGSSVAMAAVGAGAAPLAGPPGAPAGRIGPGPQARGGGAGVTEPWAGVPRSWRGPRAPRAQGGGAAAGPAGAGERGAAPRQAHRPALSPETVRRFGKNCAFVLVGRVEVLAGGWVSVFMRGFRLNV